MLKLEASFAVKVAYKLKNLELLCSNINLTSMGGFTKRPGQYAIFQGLWYEKQTRMGSAKKATMQILITNDRCWKSEERSISIHVWYFDVKWKKNNSDSVIGTEHKCCVCIYIVKWCLSCSQVVRLVCN